MVSNADLGQESETLHPLTFLGGFQQDDEDRMILHDKREVPLPTQLPKKLPSLPEGRQLIGNVCVGDILRRYYEIHTLVGYQELWNSVYSSSGNLAGADLLLFHVSGYDIRPDDVPIEPGVPFPPKEEPGGPFGGG